MQRFVFFTACLWHICTSYIWFCIDCRKGFQLKSHQNII